MFSTADKISKTAPAVQLKAAGNAFFRKAGDEHFFGAKENPAFFNKPVQAKLTVSNPDDAHEKEADAVADKVMRMPAAASLATEKQDGKLQRKDEDEVQAKQQAPLINKIQCKETAGIKLQAKLSAGISRSGEKQVDVKKQSWGENNRNINADNISRPHQAVMRQSERGPPATSTKFEQTLSSSKGRGSALPGNTRSFMESRFNADFSGVRIHTDKNAQQLSTSINAQAFAHGNDIYFNSGKFSPNSTEGGTLLAHELTHTIQQGASKSDVTVNNKNKPNVHRSLALKISSKCAACENEEKHVHRKAVSTSTPAVNDAQLNRTAPKPVDSNSTKVTFKTSDPNSTVPKSGDKVPKQNNAKKQADLTNPSVPESSKQSSKRLPPKPLSGHTGNTTNDKNKNPASSPKVSSQGAVAKVDASSSKGLLQSIANAPASSFVSMVNQSKAATGAVQSKEKAELEASQPEIVRPTGLPAISKQQRAGATILPVSQPTQLQSGSNDKEVQSESKYQEPTGMLPGGHASTAVAAPPQDDGSGSWWSWLVNKVQNFLGSIATHDDGLSTSAGQRTSVNLSGEANPGQTGQQQQIAAQDVGNSKIAADNATAAQFGENEISPTVPVENLRSAYKPTPPATAQKRPATKAPVLPDDIRVKFDAHFTPELNGKANQQQNNYLLQQEKYTAETQKTKKQGLEKINEETEQTRTRQTTLQQLAKADVSTERERWKQENSKVQEKFASQSEEKKNEINGQITEKVESTEKETDKKLLEAEQKAEKERLNTEKQAAEKKRDAENKPRSFWDSVKDSISSVFDSVRNAINGLFESLRSLVKGIIEAAKAAVNALIDMARNAIIGLIRGFGTLLKGLVSVAFAAFPTVAAKARAWIDKQVDSAVDAVNKAAEKLKEAANAALDFVGSTLDKALSVVQQGFNLIMDGLEYLAMAPFKMMELLAELKEILKKYLPLPDGLLVLKDQIIARMAALKKLLASRPKDGQKPSTGAGTVTSNSIIPSGSLSTAALPGVGDFTSLSSLQPGQLDNQVAVPKPAPPPGSGEEDDKLGGGPGGGCGLCYQDPAKPKLPGVVNSGQAVHEMIQFAFLGKFGTRGGRAEFPVNVGEEECPTAGECADLALFQPEKRNIAIGEIKPANDTKNMDKGLGQLVRYKQKLQVKYPGFTIGPLTEDIPTLPLFPTLSPTPGCQMQILNVTNTHVGLYLYACFPSYADLKKKGCLCNNEIDVPVPIPIEFPKTVNEKDRDKKFDWERVLANMALAAAITAAIALAVTLIACAFVTSPTVILGIVCGGAAVLAAAGLVLLMAKFDNNNSKTIA